jgi:hypothetical protein
LPIHVGIVIGERPLRMLHTEKNIGTVVERVRSLMWWHRVEGFYRVRHPIK